MISFDGFYASRKLHRKDIFLGNLAHIQYLEVFGEGGKYQLEFNQAEKL